MIIKNPDSGERFNAANFFVSSNEAWPTESLAAMIEAKGDGALVIGSGNAPNISPLVKDLDKLIFADSSPGHGKVFKCKLAAAKMGLDVDSKASWVGALGGSLAGALGTEAQAFDITRERDDRLHITQNEESLRRFVDGCSGLAIDDMFADVFRPATLDLANISIEALAWVHISNVVEYVLKRNHNVDRNALIGFLESLPGIKDDTLVSYSTFWKGSLRDVGISRLVVEVVRFADLTMDMLDRSNKSATWKDRDKV